MRKITSCSRVVLLTLWLPYWNPSIPHIVLKLTADRHKGEDLQLMMDCDAIGACCWIIIKSVILRTLDLQLVQEQSLNFTVESIIQRQCQNINI